MSAPTDLAQAQTRLDLIRRLTATLAQSTALEPLVRLALKHVQPLFPDGSIVLLRPADGYVHPAGLGLLPDAEQPAVLPTASDDITAGHLAALQSGQTVAVEDVAQDPRTAALAETLQDAHIHALLDVPLHRSDRLAAVLRVSQPVPHAWTAHETALLEDVAHHLALALPAPSSAAGHQLRAVLEALPDLLFIMSRDGVFLDYIPSQATEPLVPPEDFLGRHLGDLFSPALTRRMLDQYETVFQTGTPQVIEYTLPEDRDDEWYEARLIPFGENQVLSVVRDVTAEKHGERKLRQSEERWRKLVMLNPEAIFVRDTEGRFVYANDAAARLLGFDTPDAIIGRPPLDFVAPDEREVVVARLQDQMNAGTRESAYRAIRQDGTTRHVEARTTPIMYDGHPAFLSVVRDVTDQQRAEQALRDSEERFRRLFEEGPLGMAVARPDSHELIDVNAVFCAMLGYERQDLIGASFLQLTHPEDRTQSAEQIHRLYTEEQTSVQIEKRYLRKDGRSIWARLTVSSVHAGSDQYIVAMIEDITQRRQVEAALRRVNKAVESASDAIIIADLDGRFTYLNPSMQRLFGYTLEEINAGSGAAKLYPDLEQAQAIDRHLREGHDWEGIIEMETRTGQRRKISLRASPINDSQGVPIGFVGIHTDMTEQKQAEEAIRTNEALLAQAQRIARMGHWEWDLVTNDIAWSDEVFRLFGLEPQSIVPTLERFIEFVHPDDREGASATIERALQTGRPGSAEPMEYRFIRADGAVRWAWTEGYIILDETGRPFRVLGAIQDITERKMNEDALRQSEARYRLLAENATDIITLLSPEMGITYVSPSVERALGYTPDEFVQCSLADILTEESLQRAMQAHQGRLDAIAAGRPADHPIRTELQHRCKDGTLYWGENITIPLRNEGGTIIGYLATTRDITERKKTEHALIAAKEEAEEMSRLKSAFLANMSHEIRTPLTAVIGFASVLAEEVPDNKRELARYIERGGRRLLNTLNSVLDLSMLESGSLKIRRTRLDLSLEIQTKLEILQPLARDKQIQLKAVVPSYPVYATLDPSCLDRILNNLIGNAIKFTNRGSVTVEVTPGTDTVAVEVRDTGVGIDDVFLPHLFDAFKQESDGLARSYEGSGLGLTITKHLIDLMGGRIEVTSKKKHGTTFVVHFPYQAGVAPEPDISSLPQLLLVEDEAILPELIRRMLQDRFDVGIARTEEQALALARHRSFDVVLMDINLNADRTGIDALRSLRQMPGYAATPVIAVTAYALPGDREQFLELGFSAYLSKPFTREQLLHTLAAAYPVSLNE